MSGQTGDFWTPPTGEVSGSKTWIYEPTTTMTVTISASQGLRIAFRLFWDSLVALIRRETVTFEAGEDHPPYTCSVD